MEWQAVGVTADFGPWRNKLSYAFAMDFWSNRKLTCPLLDSYVASYVHTGDVQRALRLIDLSRKT